MLRPQSILVCLLLSWAIFASACIGPSNRDTSIVSPDTPVQGSFEFPFEHGQRVLLGKDGEPTAVPGPDSDVEYLSIDLVGNDPTPLEPPPPPLISVSPEDKVVALQAAPEERIPRITPLPYPEEWMSPRPKQGLFDSWHRIAILLALLVVAVIASIGAVKDW